MSKLKELARKYGYYQADNIPLEALENDWFKKHYPTPNDYPTVPQIPVGLQIRDIEVGMFYEVVESMGSYFIRTTNILVYTPKYPDLIYTLINYKKNQFNSKKNQYFLLPESNITQPYDQKLSSKFRDKEIYSLLKPRYIKAFEFTPKKINAWLDYSYNYYNAIITAYNKQIEQVNKNIQEVEKYCELGQKRGAKVHKDLDNHTTIDIDNFYIMLELLDRQTVLDKKVFFQGDIDDILK